MDRSAKLASSKRTLRLINRGPYIASLSEKVELMETVLSQPESAQIDPPEDLRSRLLTQTAGWQMLPDIAVKALAMARDPNCSIKEFSSVIERDPKLAMEILRITNSAFYTARNPILNLKQAVTRLGFAHCRNVILAASLGSAMRRIPLAEAWMQLVLWRHAVLTGVISMALNREFRLGFIGEEFTAGLIHDMGRSLFGVVAPTQFAQADPLDFEESEETLLQERSVLRTDHCELGAWFVAHNKLPQPLIDVVAYHHTPALAVENWKLVAITAVADHMANYLQRHGTQDGYDPEQNSAMNLLFSDNPANRLILIKEAHTIMGHAARESSSANGPFSAK
jgi:HD-like signal output (HDOD) protein